MTKWSVRGETRKASITLLRTGSMFLNRGDTVKVLDRGFVMSKVRVLNAGKECWVASEALR